MAGKEYVKEPEFVRGRHALQSRGGLEANYHGNIIRRPGNGPAGMPISLLRARRPGNESLYGCRDIGSPDSDSSRETRADQKPQSNGRSEPGLPPRRPRYQQGPRRRDAGARIFRGAQASDEWRPALRLP